jgi:hypothetical protein
MTNQFEHPLAPTFREAHKPQYLPRRNPKTWELWGEVQQELVEHHREPTPYLFTLVDHIVDYIGEADHQGLIRPTQAEILLDFLLGELITARSPG